MTSAKKTANKQATKKDIYAKYGISFINGKIISPVGPINELLKEGNDKTGKRIAADAGKTVCAEAARHIGNAAGIKDSSKDTNAGKCAKALWNHIADKIADAHSAADKNAEGYGRIDVTAWDIADGICHTDNHKTERKRR